MEIDKDKESDCTVGGFVNEESFTIHKTLWMNLKKSYVYLLRSQTELFDRELRLVRLDSLLEIALIRLGQEDAVVLDIYISLLDSS